MSNAASIPTVNPQEIKDGLGRLELELVNQWLGDGKTVVVYENRDLSHPDLGHRQYMTLNTFARTPYNGTPPEILPDTADRINWRYCLVGVYSGPEIS